MTYLKMPLQLQSAVAKKLQRCSYQESIAQHIMLLILSGQRKNLRASLFRHKF